MLLGACRRQLAGRIAPTGVLVSCRALVYSWRQVRRVSTLSPLAATFNTKAKNRLSEIFTQKTTGLFGIEALREPMGFYLMKDDATIHADRLVNESCSANRQRKMVAIFDELSDTLCKVADLAEFIRVAHPNHKYLVAAEDVCLSINALVERLNTNPQLYSALKNVVENGDIMPTDSVDDHVTKLFLFDFEQSGIHLSDQKRKRVVELNECILQLGSLFMQSTFSSRAVPKNKLPEGVASFFPTQGDNAIVSGLYADSSNDLVREMAYRIYMYPDANQERRLQDLLEARFELAQLCGFPTFAHRVLHGSLAETPEAVARFIDTLSEQLWPRADHDLDLMRKVKHENCLSAHSELRMWDTSYLNALVKQQKFQLNTMDFAPYFSLGGCMEGLNHLLGCLYNVTLELNETSMDEIWAPDVHKLAVVHGTEGLLGYIYCDFLERPGKPNQDCHFTIRGGRQLPDNTYQLPVVVLVLNFPSPTCNSPSLLTPGMVENLFHEMGHALHSMLARTKYQHVTGTRCSTDFAEVPSVLMEYFASDARVLSKFAIHYRTGERIPFDMLEELCCSRNLLCAGEMQLQVFYSMLDQFYHGNLQEANLTTDGSSISRGNTTDVLASVQAKYYGIPHERDTAWQLRFGHLVGYGAKYYSYIMSKAIASWIWQQEFRNDPFSRDAGERYRQQLLAHGGGRPPRELIEGFLRQTATPEAMVKSLISDIDAKQTKY